jgi:hypothetical protein
LFEEEEDVARSNRHHHGYDDFEGTTKNGARKRCDVSKKKSVSYESVLLEAVCVVLYVWTLEASTYKYTHENIDCAYT